MIRVCLFLIVVGLPSLANALTNEWKTIACTIEYPEEKRGEILTIYFTENGQVRLGEKQHMATVTEAEITFSFPTLDSTAHYKISRISGGFSLAIIGPELMTAKGSCIPQSQQRKF